MKKVKVSKIENGKQSAIVEMGDYKNMAMGKRGNIDFAFGGNAFELAQELGSVRDINSVTISGGKEQEVKSKIKKTLFYWENEPIVYKCITLLSQLANNTFTISCEDKKVESALKKWWVSIKGDEFLKYFFLEYFRSCNVPILRTNIDFIPRNGFVSKDGNKRIAGGYTILNPLNVTLKTLEIPGIKKAYLKLGSDFISLISSKKDEVSKILPPEISKNINRDTTEIELPPEVFSMVTKDKQPYEEWALPLTSHAFEALDYKREIREMDKATVKGIRNRILKVTIGSDNFPVTDPNQIKRLADKFRSPSKNLTIFWDHTLDIKYIEPNLESLNVDKYIPATDDIMTNYGISKVLLGAKGDSSGNNALCLKGMIEILEDARTAFTSWFLPEITEIASVMTNSKVDSITVSFGNINLKDENDYYRVLMQMVDRQLISYETAMETIGYYFPKELKRLESEKKVRDSQGILVAQKAPTQGGGSEDSSDIQKTGGRPKGIKEGERKNSVNKPKTPSGVKSIASEGREICLAASTLDNAKDMREYFINKVMELDIAEEKKKFVKYLTETSSEFKNKKNAINFMTEISRFLCE